MNDSKKSAKKLPITPKTSEIEKLKSTTASTTVIKTLPHKSPLPADPYITFKDAVWKDVVVHERKLDKIWNSTWASFILPSNGRRTQPRSKSSNVLRNENDTEKISPETKRKLVYGKSSDIYGCFGVNHVVLQKQQDMAQPPLVSRIRFVPQQYGHYRKLKYAADAKGTNLKEENILMPTSKIRHTVNPLLC